MALTPEEIITAFGEMTDAQKKALKSAIGAESSVPSGKKLDEQIAKLAQYKKALDQIKDIEEMRAQQADVQVQLLELIRKKTADHRDALLAAMEQGGKYDEEEVKALTDKLNLIQQYIDKTKELESIRSSINEQLDKGIGLSDKLTKSTREWGVAIADGKAGLLGVHKALSFGMKQADGFFGKMLTGAKDMIFGVDQATKAFQRQFQFSEKYNAMLIQQYKNMNEYGVSIENVTAAHSSLVQITTDFTMMARAQQNLLSSTAALAGEQGVAFDDFARGAQASMKFFGESAAGAERVSRELLSTAKALGVAPGQLSAQFGAMAGQFAKFGDQGVRAFKDVARIAKLTGFEMEKVLALTNKFDTFEDAAEMTGKLNAALGGNFVNAMDMMMATDPAERFEMIRESLENAGLSFDDMSYYQRKFYADSLGLSDVGDLALMMSGNMDMLGDSSNRTAEDYVEMQERAQASMSVMEAFKAIIQDNAEGLVGFAETLSKITKYFLQNGHIVQSAIKAYAAFKLIMIGLNVARGIQLAKKTAIAAQTAIEMGQNTALIAQNTAIMAQMSGQTALTAAQITAATGLIAAEAALTVEKTALATAQAALAASTVPATGGMMAFGTALLYAGAGIALILGSAALFAAALGLAGDGIAKIFDSISFPKMAGLAVFFGVLAIAAYYLPITAGALGLFAAGLIAVGLALAWIATRDLEAIATFTESLASTSIGEINALTRAIKGVAKAMDDVPTKKALALTMTMQSTAVAATAARALVSAGGLPAAATSRAAGTGAAGSMEHTVNIVFDPENKGMFKKEVVKLTREDRGISSRAAANGQGQPLPQ